jgi:hypothetical protein
MNNSSFYIFSIIRNVENFIKKNVDKDFKILVNRFMFIKARPYHIENCKRIYNEIENNYYNHDDMIFFMLYRYMMEDKCHLGQINRKNLAEFKKLISKSKTKEDMEFLKSIYKEMEFKSLDDFFELKEDGTNVAYMLTKKGYISPVFFIKNAKKLLTNDCDHVIFKCKEYAKFERIAYKIKQIKTGGFNAS